MAFVRDHDGTSHEAGDYASGGQGTGASLQDSALESHGAFLYLLGRGNARIARLDVSRPTQLEYLDLTGELAPFASGIAVY